MAHGTAADELRPDNGTSFFGKIAWVVSPLVLASGMAAWIADFSPVSWISNPAFLEGATTTSFDDRFSQSSLPNSSSSYVPRPLPVQSMPSELEAKFRQAKGLLAQKLQSEDRRTASADQPGTSVISAVPLPKSRPVEASLELRNSALAPQANNRTLLQKLTDLIPARVTLASLAPDGGLFRDGPDLTSLGYDNFTAVYDISARAVYMPNGSKLEAHSGLGSLMDDPEHVNKPNVGATPPNVYDLKPRERLFHGVKALRMIPVGDNDTLGRSGLLVHSYLLGPNGDSNGCVSIRNYDQFLNAFQNGVIKRLVVVPSLGGGMSAQRSTSQS
jgi:hypothetical protein